MAPPMFSQVKKIPKWAIYTSAGAVAAGAAIWFRRRKELTAPAADDGTGGDVGSDVSPDGVTDGSGVASTMPGIVVPPIVPSGDGSQLNTDIPESTLALIGDIFGTQAQGQAAYLQTLAEAGVLPVNPKNKPPVPVAAPPRPPAPAPHPPPPPRANPCTKLPHGYHCGATVTDGHLHKHLSGAVGWVRFASGGKGSKHYIDYHVRYCRSLARYRYRPNLKTPTFKRIWIGPRPNIC